MIQAKKKKKEIKEIKRKLLHELRVSLRETVLNKVILLQN